jgi:cell division GTPase FtsZ
MAVHSEAEIIYGAIIDERMAGTICVTVIMGDFEAKNDERAFSTKERNFGQ